MVTAWLIPKNLLIFKDEILPLFEALLQGYQKIRLLETLITHIYHERNYKTLIPISLHHQSTATEKDEPVYYADVPSTLRGFPANPVAASLDRVTQVPCRHRHNKIVRETEYRAECNDQQDGFQHNAGYVLQYDV